MNKTERRLKLEALYILLNSRYGFHEPSIESLKFVSNMIYRLKK